jgi:FMN phosphatase YigB (HAD superfamily)
MQKTAFFDLDYTLYEGYTATTLLRFLADSGHVEASLADEIHQLHEDYIAGLVSYRDAAERALKLNTAVMAGKTEAEDQRTAMQEWYLLDLDL